MIGSFGVWHHQYADDTQMYIAASKSDLKANIDTLEKCTAASTSVVTAQRSAAESKQIQGDSAGRGREQVDDVSSLQVYDAAIQPSPTI